MYCGNFSIPEDFMVQAEYFFNIVEFMFILSYIYKRLRNVLNRIIIGIHILLFDILILTY